MSIVLKLANGNSADSQIKIYRSTSRIEDNALPAPIAVLPGNAKTYTEQDYLFYDVDYFYRVEVVSPLGESVLYPNTVHRLGLDVGPGPKDLVAGDENFGLFGVFAPWDWEAETAEIMRKFLTVNYASTRLIKYIRDGVIYYTTNRVQTLPMATLWANNALATKNSNPYVLNPAITANYAIDREHVIGNSKYAFRLPQLVEKSQANTTFTTTNYSINADHSVRRSEAIDLYRSFHEFAFRRDKKSIPFKVSVFANATATSLAVADSTNSATQYYGITLTISAANSFGITNSTFALNTSTTTGLLLAEYRGIAV